MNKVKLAILISIGVFFQSTVSRAADVTVRYLVRSPGISVREYNAYLLTDPSASPIVEHIKKEAVDASSLEALKNEFEKAQLAYLNSEDETMHEEWLNLISYAYKADWPKRYREMIGIGFLRLAQISTSAEDTKKWLAIAVGFDSKYQPDRSLFPPPLVAQYKEIRAAEQKINVPIQSWNGFEWALVNGTPIHLAGRSTLSLPDQTVRLTLLSSVYQPVTRVMPVRALLQFQPRMLPWVSGTCQTPLWTGPQPQNETLAALFPNSCVVIRGQSQPIFPLSAQPLASDIPSGADLPVESNGWAAPSITASAPSRSKPFYKSGWFWLGTALVAGAIVYSQERSGSSSAVPTHTTGF